MDEAVPVNMHEAILTVRQPWHGGTVMVMAAPPHQAEGQEISSISKKGGQASRLPVHGSTSNLIYGAAVGTI